MHYDQFLDAFRDLYGGRALSEGEFIGIVRQLQERQPLINYIETTIYEDIYRELVKHGDVNLDRTIELTNYLIHTNREAIKQDVQFYLALVEKLEANGDTFIDSGRLRELLLAKNTLNECLVKCLLGCFAATKSISVRKLRLLIEQLKVEICGGGSLSFIGEFDVARSMWADTSRAERREASTFEQPREASSVEDLAQDFFRKLAALLDFIEYDLTDSTLQSKAEIVRKKQAEFSQFFENEQADSSNEIEYLKAARRELDEELLQERAQRELLAAHLEKLEVELEKLNKQLDEHSEERINLSRTIRELHHSLNEKQSQAVQMKTKLKSLQEDNSLLKETLQELMSSASDIQMDNERLKKMMEASAPTSDSMLEDRTLKMELDDAYIKLRILEEQLDEERTRNKHYERELEQYQFRLEDMQLQMASRVNLQVPALGQEGIRQSYFLGSRIYDGNMKSRIAQVRESAVQNVDLAASSVKPFRESVMMGRSRLQPPSVLPLDKSMVGNSRLKEIVDSNKSSLAVRLDLSQVPFTPPRPESSPKTSPTKFSKKAVVPEIYVDVTQQLYQHDYAEMREIDKVKELLEHDKEDCEFQERYLDRRFRFFSCSAKLVHSNGNIQKMVVVVTCTNLHLLRQSKGKWSAKSPVRLTEIRKLLFGDHSYLLVVRFGGESDYLLLTSRRRELALFLTEVRVFINQEDPLPIEKYNRNRDIVVIENRKELELSSFQSLFTPYTVCFQYYQFCSEVFLEFKRLLGGSEFKPVFLVVNYAGLHFLDNDQLETKHDFKDKLILYLPVLPNLNVVEFGQQDEKLVKLKYEEGILQAYNVRCRSASQKEDLVAQVRSIRSVMLQRKEDQQRQDKQALHYREIE